MEKKKHTMEVPCEIGDPVWAVLAYMKPSGQSCKVEYEMCQLECAGFEITESYYSKPKVRIIPRFTPSGFQKSMVYADEERAKERLSTLKAKSAVLKGGKK